MCIRDREDGVAELADQVDEIDEDLGTLEEDYYGLGDDCGCHAHGDEDEAVFEAVSYTHLDVYKRQTGKAAVPESLRKGCQGEKQKNEKRAGSGMAV